MYLRPKDTYFLSINIIWSLLRQREDECGPLRSTSVQPIHRLCCHKITEDRGQVLWSVFDLVQMSSTLDIWLRYLRLRAMSGIGFRTVGVKYQSWTLM